MMKKREDILMFTVQSYPDTKISQVTGYSRPLISKVRGRIKTLNVFEQTSVLGRPIKVTDNLYEAICSMTKNNPRMSCNDASRIIRNNQYLSAISPTTIWRIWHNQGNSIDDLISTIFMTWENIGQNEINNLIDSIPDRLQAVLNKNGMQSGY